MKWSTHFITGMTVGLLFARFLGEDYLLYGLTGALFGVLPDADIILDKLYLAEHRGAYSHSLGASLVMGAIAAAGAYFLFSMGLQESVVLGSLSFTAAFSHVVLDSFTYSGVEMMWPLTSRRYKGWVRYDSLSANFGIILACLGILYISGVFSEFLDILHFW